ncbi:TonB-dependent receptor [Flavobacterium silvaticum]|uniref:TonB-dependent receptor n=1 Tax=Flavobacterium silvaticum TaxID=1852020 RepID=A0A972FMB5_9FLAO|nr:TonB-dependent receptor [Flavobacterium silvaticum]NMH28689.1 TonB-dependent receptor [Flavobacterium silvaticum]
MTSKSIKHLFQLLVVLLFSFATDAQTGTITGTVTLSTTDAPENISVVLKNTQIGTVTNAQGVYEIKNIKPGTYVLRVSLVGYSSKETTITVTANQTVSQDFTLTAGEQRLSEVIVESAKVNKYARKESAVVSKMPLKDIENPQVYNTISAELLKEQNITTFDDALKNAPGIDRLWESTGRGGDGAGYFSLRGFAVQPTMVNGLPGLSNGSPDPANIERIEVIKGPSGTLFGSSLISYGGLINVTTKRPYNSFGGSISYIGGTYGLNRVTADINTPIGTDNKAAVRLNAAYHNENSFQDAGFRKSVFVAPSLTYEVNDRLSFFVNTEFYNGKSTNQTMLFVDRGSELRVHNPDELGYDYKRSYTSNDLFLETPTYNLQGQMIYKISKNWTSQTAVSRSSAKSRGYYSYLYEVTSTVASMSGTPINDGIILARFTSKQDFEAIGTDIQQNFIGEYSLGSIKNKFIGGLDYYNMNTLSNSTGYGNQGFINIGVDEAYFAAVAPSLHAFYGTPMGTRADDTGVLTQDGADAGIAALANPGTDYYKTRQDIYSAYVSNVTYFLPNLSAMVSLRFDRFMSDGDVTTSDDDYNQSAWSPKFGLVYQPIKDKVAVFANYMNGFSNVAPINTGSAVLIFDPEQANQFEFGTKINLLGDKLVGSASYYHTKVSNKVLNVAPEVYTQGGEQVNKGFEASITANPFEGLNLVAGYSYNDSVLEQADINSGFAGMRPESAGPRNLANLWASYKFGNGSLKGFGLGFGGNYASENKVFNRSNAGTFTLPEYTVFNASVFYNIAAFQVNLKLDNIGNKEYYKGWSTISPQDPRTFSASVTYNF